MTTPPGPVSNPWDFSDDGDGFPDYEHGKYLDDRIVDQPYEPPLTGQDNQDPTELPPKSPSESDSDPFQTDTPGGQIMMQFWQNIVLDTDLTGGQTTFNPISPAPDQPPVAPFNPGRSKLDASIENALEAYDTDEAQPTISDSEWNETLQYLEGEATGAGVTLEELLEFEPPSPGLGAEGAGEGDSEDDVLQQDDPQEGDPQQGGSSSNEGQDDQENGDDDTEHPECDVGVDAGSSSEGGDEEGDDGGDPWTSDDGGGPRGLPIGPGPTRGMGPDTGDEEGGAPDLPTGSAGGLDPWERVDNGFLGVPGIGGAHLSSDGEGVDPWEKGDGGLTGPGGAGAEAAGQFEDREPADPWDKVGPKFRPVEQGSFGVQNRSIG